MVAPQFRDPFLNDTFGGSTDTKECGPLLLAVFRSDFPRVLVNQLLRKIYMPQLERHKRPISDPGKPSERNDRPVAALYDGSYRTAFQHAFNLLRRRDRPEFGSFGDSRILLRKSEIVGITVPYP